MEVYPSSAPSGHLLPQGEKGDAVPPHAQGFPRPLRERVDRAQRETGEGYRDV